MTQAGIERAYSEAVEQLARAVEANRLLTERLQAYEIREAKIRSAQGEADTLAILDRPVGPSHDEEPPASPGVPT